MPLHLPYLSPLPSLSLPLPLPTLLTLLMLPLAATVITVVTDAILAASTAVDKTAAVATDIAAADTT